MHRRQHVGVFILIIWNIVTFIGWTNLDIRFLSILSFPQTPTLFLCFTFCTQPSFSVLHSSFIVVRLFPPLFFSVQVCPFQLRNNCIAPLFVHLFLNVICFCYMSTSTLPVFQSVMTLYSGRRNNLYCFLQFSDGFPATCSPFLLLNCLVMCSDFAVTSLQS